MLVWSIPFKAFLVLDQILSLFDLDPPPNPFLSSFFKDWFKLGLELLPFYWPDFECSEVEVGPPFPELWVGFEIVSPGLVNIFS